MKALISLCQFFTGFIIVIVIFLYNIFSAKSKTAIYIDFMRHVVYVQT